MGQMTFLSGINRMLRANNQQPVASLSDDGVNDTALAQQILRQQLVLVQEQGQWCNTTVSQYHPTSAGYIDLPQTTLFVQAVQNSLKKQVCALGPSTNTRLYDLQNRTYVFTDSVTLKLVVGHPFQDLPTDMQYWIVDQAALVYQQQATGDPQMTKLLQYVANKSRALSRANDIRSKKRSILDTVNGSAMTKRRFGYRLGG